MSDTETDLAVIGGAIDGNGDEVPQEHPIENPGREGGDGDDPVSAPHPDEPGMSGPSAEPGPEPAETADD
jgi:hypothetical protein